MSENRRAVLTDAELETLADKLVLRMTPSGECRLTEEQQRAVVELITTKKKVVRWTLYLIGAMLLWVAKDVYLTLVSHISWGGR